MYENNFFSRVFGNSHDSFSCNQNHNIILGQYLQGSRATDGTLIYADIGPNVINQIQKFTVTDGSNYRVQYAEINHNAKAPQSLCDHELTPTVIEEELRSGSNTLSKLFSTWHCIHDTLSMLTLHPVSVHRTVTNILTLLL